MHLKLKRFSSINELTMPNVSGPDCPSSGKLVAARCQSLQFQRLAVHLNGVALDGDLGGCGDPVLGIDGHSGHCCGSLCCLRLIQGNTPEYAGMFRLINLVAVMRDLCGRPVDPPTFEETVTLLRNVYSGLEGAPRWAKELVGGGVSLPMNKR